MRLFDSSLQVSEASSVILLDALDLKIKTCSLKLADGACWDPQEVRLIPEDERVELSFANSLPLGALWKLLTLAFAARNASMECLPHTDDEVDCRRFCLQAHLHCQSISKGKSAPSSAASTKPDRKRILKAVLKNMGSRNSR